MRQPDIEIYLKDSDQDAVAEWLSQAIAPCSPWQSRGKTQQCQAGEIPVLWLHKAVGNWHCLLLESDRTPWEDDLACARAANAALGVPIRCAPGSWDEGEAEEEGDRWLQVTTEGVSEILWRT